MKLGGPWVDGERPGQELDDESATGQAICRNALPLRFDHSCHASEVRGGRY